MKPANNKKFPSGRFSSSLLTHIEQIENSDSVDSQYENKVMLDDFDLFVNQKKSRRGNLVRSGTSA
ncbi:hypothetical protein [Nitrosopumilus ureiphilus]|jgi:hypothetical protein|uniref:Uncharacterized protein n=1 Tax=Nitrosopumilus ureiphilus TaxID=1470067 RepID=A0A7D5M394_9ARCH|nr:hypothetical protein [Nitrosopumilus ureiphilus]QLH06106.1 hypothetical protein C5F50_02710 [Nitrosopumilus ureiphilus]